MTGLRTFMTWLLPFALLASLSGSPAAAAPAPAPAQAVIGVRHLSLVDESRQVKVSSGFAGAATRRIDVTVWYPADSHASTGENATAAGGQRPLVIYSHGSFAHAESAMHLVLALVHAGYIVAAPDYPLSSRTAYTHITGADPSDVGQQARDIRFILDRLLADKDVAALIDPNAIATAGHSLGGVTSYFTSYASGVRDRRIKAAVLLGAGDPVQAALSMNMGLLGNLHIPVPVPVLFLDAEHDAIARYTGRAGAAYARVEPPKYKITIKGGVHIWFADSTSQPAGGGNPDCVMMGKLTPGSTLPGCEPGNRLIAPQRQQEITRIATIAFLDAYLKGDKAQLKRLRTLPATIPEIDERFEN